MNTTQIIILLLVIIALISLIAILRDKNLRQKLRLPGIFWTMETSDGKRRKQPRSTDKSRSTKLEFGENNQFGGKVENIAGGDVSIQQESTKPPAEKSSVNFGKGNTFLDDVKNVAGGNLGISDKDDKK